MRGAGLTRMADEGGALLREAQLTAFYSAREPSKLENVPLLLEKFTPAQIAASVWRNLAHCRRAGSSGREARGAGRESRWKTRKQGTVDVWGGAGPLNRAPAAKQIRLIKFTCSNKRTESNNLAYEGCVQLYEGWHAGYETCHVPGLCQ